MGGFSLVFSDSFNELTANECGFSNSFSSGSFNTCVDVEGEEPEVVVNRGGNGSRAKGKRLRYWWEPEEEKQLPQPEVVAISPVIIDPLPFVPRRPFAEPAKKINKRRAVMIAALLDE